MQLTRMTWVGALVVCTALACSKEKPAEQKLAPTASALEASLPAAPGALTFGVDASGSRFTFLMDSPLEKIEGEALAAISGELFIDPSDLSGSTALLKADLKQLTLYQQKRAGDKEAYGERTKSETQNEHARGWFELDAKEGEVTPAQAEANRFAELKISKLENLSATDVTKLAGDERKVTATASGDFRLHGRKAPKTAKVELNFKYAGDKLSAVEVKTLEPFVVGLEEFEIHPRDAAGKLVKKLSDALASNLKGKVAKEAPVHVSFVATRK